MKHTKKHTLISLILAAVTAFSAAFIVPPESGIGMSIESSAYDKYEWNARVNPNKCSEWSVDTSTYYGNSSYSIKIENKDYNAANVEKYIKLKPNTQYRFSAMVKYSGYELKPGIKSKSGAYLAVTADKSSTSHFITSKSWELAEVVFCTDNSDECVFELINGSPECKGTAWFSDIRLEELTETTDNWNVLVLVVKHIKADVEINGNIVHVDQRLNDADVKYLKTLSQPIKDEMAYLSKGLCEIKDIDVVPVEDTVTELEKVSKNSYHFRCSDPAISRTIDKSLSKKTYQQIIIFAENSSYSSEWVGLNIGKYRDINCYICRYISGSELFSIENREGVDKYFPLLLIFHEMCHSLEMDSKAIDGDKTPEFHDVEKNYGYSYYKDGEQGLRQCYSDYMTRNLYDGSGINPKAFYRPAVYTLVTDDMTPGYGVTVAGTLPTHISKAAAVPKIADKYYAGKAVKPTVTVKGLTKGTDYTVTYDDNNAPGTAKAIIKGKGKYTGSIEVTFKIKLKSTTAKVSKSALKWGKVPGADGYKIYYSNDGGKYKLLKDVTAVKYDLSKLKKGTYKFKVRAYAKTNSGTVYSEWSKVVNYTKK